MSESQSKSFRMGVNYWPARSAMEWWSSFDQAEVEADFARIAACGFDSVRIFLTWEDFQPEASKVDGTMIEHLLTTMNAGSAAGLSLMPTLFTGHMSGVNLIPPWALDTQTGGERFRVIAERKVTDSRPLNWYSDPTVLRAQALLARELAAALSGHPALWAWDLGNENSNCTVPPNKASARAWLLQMTDAIRGADSNALVTIGLHMEDLEQDRHLGPHEAAKACDFLTMHGYPGYAAWADGPTDQRLLPFLTRLTQWLGCGAEVLFSEFGVPTLPVNAEENLPSPGPRLVTELEAAAYYKRALNALAACGSTGAMLWCFSDYSPTIWQRPPLDVATHERSFGLWHSDGSPKPAVGTVQDFVEKMKKETRSPDSASPSAPSWLDLDSQEFYRNPELHLPRLYKRYCESQS